MSSTTHKMFNDQLPTPDFRLPTSDSRLSDFPKNLGYYFPAEFAPHTATWLVGRIKMIHGREKFIPSFRTIQSL